MMFSIPFGDYEPDPEIVAALQLILILHADHEQNCSSSTVRMVASSGANLFASCAAGVCALWGPLHGGANAAVVEMLQQLHDDNVDLKDYIARVKDKNSSLRLMGFGHRVYKSYDPRASIMKETADKLLNKLKGHTTRCSRSPGASRTSPSTTATSSSASSTPTWTSTPGVILRAMGIPVNMFTVIFAMGRMPGWIANWKEVHDTGSALYRPRQIYVGQGERPYVPIDERGTVDCLAPAKRPPRRAAAAG